MDHLYLVLGIMLAGPGGTGGAAASQDPFALSLAAINAARTGLAPIVIALGFVGILVAGVMTWIAPKHWAVVMRGSVIGLVLGALAGPISTWILAQFGGSGG